MSVLLFGISGAWGAYAHPHNWISLNTHFVLDQRSALVSIKQRWQFDVYYSMMTLSDVVNEFGSAAKGLPITASRMIKNLANYDYFSTLKINGQTVALKQPQDYALITTQRDGQPVLVLEMTFDLARAIPIEKKALTWQVYDPTYFIAMNHETESNLEILGGNATECSTVLHVPEPGDDLINYAQSLDRFEKETDGLGESFSEIISINCH